MIRSQVSRDAEVFANALGGRGPRNSDAQRLVQFAESLCKAAVDPSEDFVLSLRAELMADASSVLVLTHKPDRTASSTPAPHSVRKRLTVATAGVLATAGILGIVASSAQALPGDMLYPVKRGVESIELTMHRGDASRGSFQLSQATERLTEARTLAAQHDPRTDGLVIKTLADFSDTAAAGSGDLFADYTNGGGNASVNKVNSFASASSSVLSSFSGNLSPGTLKAFKLAALTVNDLASQASTMCSECQSANLTSLQSRVAAFINNAGAKTSTPNGTTTTKAPSTLTPVVAGNATNVAPKLPIVSVVPTVPPTNVGDATDPLLGALLGDDKQTGVVPGLLGGLLGGH